MVDKKIKDANKCRKNTGNLIAMGMQRCNVGHIAQWSTSRASLEATGCRHWASACAILSRRPPWLLILNLIQNTNKTHLFVSNYCTLFVSKPSNFWDPKWTLYSAHQCNKLRKNVITQLLELRSLKTFLAIKRCRRTKIQKVINLEQSLLKKLAHICATSG